MYLRKFLQTICLPVLLLCSMVALAQRTVTGRVTDPTGRGVAGATVTVKGQQVAAVTAEDGSFSIAVPANANTLTITSVGFTAQEISVLNSASANVVLQSSASNLNEVVVIGYGTARRRDVTGAVTAITSKDFNKGAIVTPEQLIAGRVAGVQITSNGGAPGAGSTIRIRGGASLNASNDPLIVIDGVPIASDRIAGAANPLALINPNDIESFNILKDASAAAIYGSRASNGVIIITTKKGRGGRPVFNFSTQNTLSTLPKKADVLSPDEFRTFVQQYGTQAQVALLGQANTDWQNEIYGNAFMTDNNLSVSGSVNNRLPYRLSVGYLNQDGILRTGTLRRTSAALNLNPTFFNNHLRVDVSLKGSIAGQRFAEEDAIGSAVRFDPTQPTMSRSQRFGGYFQWLDPNSVTGLKALAPRNPLGLLEQRRNESDVKRSIGNIQFDYKLHFLPELRVNLNLGYDMALGEGSVFVPDSAAAAYRRSPDARFGGEDNRYREKNGNALMEAYLNYTKDLTGIRSRIDVTAGYSYQDFYREIFNAEQDPNGVLYQRPDGSLDTTRLANATRWNPYRDRTTNGFLMSFPTFPYDKPQNRLISFFGRLNYTYNGKYLLTATLRRDGSSRFAPDNRWGLFPSGAFAWRIKDEDFLRGSRTISDLKLRVGYGITGQQEGIGLYDYQPRYTQSNLQAQYQLGNQFFQMLRPAGYNPNLKWEQTATSNVGIDYGFLAGRISGSLDFYLKKTTDLLSEIDQPAGTNFSNKITANIGEMENRGVEFLLNTQPVRSRDLNVEVNFNATYNQNKITRLTFTNDPTFPGNLVGGIAGGVGTTAQIHSVGFPRSSFFVYQQIYDKNGKPIEGLFEDRNRDGLLNNEDLYRYKSPDPEWFLGASSSVSYKRFDAGFVLRANLGNYMYNNRFSNTGTRRNIIDPLGFLANGSRNVLETNFVGSGDRYLLSDYYVENASFLRMDMINVGFNAGDVLRRGTVLRFGATVQNAFVITKYRGVDPEGFGIDNNFYPRPRNFVFNVNLSF